jgi:hypothetical protein
MREAPSRSYLSGLVPSAMMGKSSRSWEISARMMEGIAPQMKATTSRGRALSRSGQPPENKV